MSYVQVAACLGGAALCGWVAFDYWMVRREGQWLINAQHTSHEMLKADFPTLELPPPDLDKLTFSQEFLESRRMAYVNPKVTAAMPECSRQGQLWLILALFWALTGASELFDILG